MLQTHRRSTSALFLGVISFVVPFSPTAYSQENAIKSWVPFNAFQYEGRDSVYSTRPPAQGEYYNPILAGFYPDPSICRRGDDFYLVNSTFAYFPGVPIFHSTDLVTWNQIGHVLDRPSQLNLDGLPVSSGIFAPAITHHDGVFYMITTNVQGIGNFFVTANDPAGPWSDPMPLQFDGIDPSFFFDDGGSIYVVHNGTPPDNKPLYDGHRAIWLWEFDPKTRTVINGRIIINGGVDISQQPVWIEGPHLFKRNGYYYLSCAEGGTSVNHSQVIFRTESLDEPFKPGPGNPILTQRDRDPDRPNPVTALGHADLVETRNGTWWAVFLGIRPYERGYSNIGRETFLLPVSWEDDWPMILEPGELLPRVVRRPDLPVRPSSDPPTTGVFSWRDDFDSDVLGMSWVILRTPRSVWWSLSDEPGTLLIKPRPDRLTSVNRRDPSANQQPSFVACRLQHHDFTAATSMLIRAQTIDCEAGLAALQNNTNYFFLGVRVVAGKGRSVFLESGSERSTEAVIIAEAMLPEGAEQIELRIEGAGKDYRFDYRLGDSKAWTNLANGVDGTLLSTSRAEGFVGAMIGLHARVPSQGSTDP